ncbi:tRNA dihydrouridine synthase DusB [Bacteroidota bacterium]
MTIGKINIENGLLLAPMEGITDLPFRIICKKMGADLVYTEFIASDALIRDAEKSKRKMEIIDEEHPVSIQIFGANVEAMCHSAKMIEDSGGDIVDINFGCWVKKVVNNNAGAAFLKEPKKMAEMAKAVVESVSIPVTVKTRLGWDFDSIVIVEAAQMLEQAGISAIAVHCRTRAMAMHGHADWNWIPKVKEKVNIPVILNGDVVTPEDTKKAFDTTGCDAVMIGRAAVGNPFIFRDVKEFLRTGIKRIPSVRERIDTCLDHLKLSMKYKGDPRGLYEFRKHYSGYLKGLYHGSNTRQKLVLMESYKEIKETLNEFYNFLEKEDRLETSK